MRRMKIAIMAASLCVCSVCLAADYWPMQDGLIWRYGAGTASDFEFGMTCVDSACVRGYDQIVGQYGSSQGSEFRTNADGDIVLASSWYWSTGAIDPDHWNFNPPLIFLDLPLEVGKQWVSMSGTTVFIGNVTSESVVQAPSGTYNVLVVEISDLFNRTRLSGTYFLERSIGPVKYEDLGLSYFNGTVGVAESNWGSLKALYR